MIQPDLFTDWPEPPSVPVATSVAAAKALGSKAGRDRARVLDFIRERGAAGATDEETQAALNLSGDTQRPRRWELHKAGLIRDSGQTRRTRAGNKATVWILSGASA